MVSVSGLEGLGRESDLPKNLSFFIGNVVFWRSEALVDAGGCGSRQAQKLETFGVHASLGQLSDLQEIG